MDTSNTKFKTVDEYIAAFPAKVKTLLKQMRKTIKAAAPEAEEVISYNMPGYKLHGMLVYFAAHSNHIGFYPGTSVMESFEKMLSSYEKSKGTIRFPISEPLPLEIIKTLVRFRVEENKQKWLAKQKKK